MKKILFLIHDLGQGGAEKVLVNLVNNMDPQKFDISVTALFGGGVNEQFLMPHIHYHAVFRKSFPGNSHIMKLFSPKALHRWFIHRQYDIEVSYLEGPCARIVSGCPDSTAKLVSWIHVQLNNLHTLARSFRNHAEAISCYNRFDKTICVSEYVRNDFCNSISFEKPCEVLYNTVESDKIISASKEAAPELSNCDTLKLVAVGTLKPSKGYKRLLRIIKTLISEGHKLHLFILGIGPMRENIEEYIRSNQLESIITLLGYHTNPYKYVAKCDLFVCASYAEGFSTAATEALIVGTPVCTVEVSGMKEMLGENNEWGIVTENSEEALYQGIKRLLDHPELLAHYKKQAAIRGKTFNTENTVKAVENMLLSL
jgi:glycosyltransferase involved in cell wall biosynthesis